MMNNVTLELTLAELNVIMKYLGAGAYVEVADLVVKIRQQAEPQLNVAPQTPKETP